jgi:two-component system phosphate regulon sensor histidine kinase PhoR
VRRRIFLKFVFSFLAVILLATLLLDFLAGRQFERTHIRHLKMALREKALLIGDELAKTPPTDVGALAARAALHGNARVTIIAPDGTVLADSEAKPSEMENHATRPEFAAALRGSFGSAMRTSSTVHVRFLYVAVPLPAGPWRGGALRLAYPLSEVDRSLAAMRRQILFGSGLAVLAAMALAAALAGLTSRRLNRVVRFANAVAEGRLGARIPAGGSDEIATVIEALNKTADKLEEGFARLRASTQQMEAVLEAMEEGVIAADAGGRVLCANRAVCRMLRAPIAPGMTLEQAAGSPELLAAMRRALASGEAAAADLHVGSPPRWLKLSCSPMLAAGSRAAGAVAVLHDVTDLEHVEKMRKDFVANVSHELRTPLTSIQGYAETLLESDLLADPRSREFVEIIRRHALRMAKLTADLLTLSRIELGRHEFRFEPIAAGDVVQAAIQSFEQVAQARSIALTAEAISGGSWVTADSDAIHQVLINLLDNALKYTSSGGSVTVSARPGNGVIEFCVADTGAGIGAEHLPRLFERFYRVDKARSRELGGTGLGLSIVKHIVLAHGGDVRVESEPGRGSSFFFTLPEAPAGARLPAEVL